MKNAAAFFGAVVSTLGVAAYSQNISASLSGTVRDRLDAVLPGAEVTLTNEQGFVRTTRTNESGFFSFPDLTPSTFVIRVRAQGFREYTATGIEVTSGMQRSLGSIVLQVGQLAESVTVTAEAAPVQLGSSEKANTLTSRELEGMALRGRDVMDAVGLLPGVVDTADSREAPSPTSIGNLYLAGGRNNSKNMTIDGITNLDTGSNGSVHQMPSMDSIAELKVMLSNYAPEYGRNAGGTISVITKGGGRDFHGSASWYYRHESFSANNFFANRSGLPRNPYRYNIGGYTISGPLYIPGKMNRDRARAYFFFSQEFQRQRVDQGLKIQRVPTAAERNGDFSNSQDTNGNIIRVLDPLNGRKQFPGNIVPANRINPTGQAILNMFPLPNYVDPTPVRRPQYNYISQMSGPYPRRTETFRVDFSPRDNMQWYVRGSENSDEQHPYYGNWTNGSVNFPLVPVTFRQPGRGITLHGTTTLSPSTFSETIFGISQNKLTYFPEDPARVSKSALGIHLAQWNPSLNPDGWIPNMTFGNVPNYANPSMSNGMPYYNSNTIFSFVQNVSRIWRTHSFKAGVYIERTRKDQSANAATRGAIAFDQNGNNPLDANYAYANALLGAYYSYSEATARPQGQYRFTNLEWYGQDAWRIRRNLLLDYGVRFYHDMPQYDARNQLAAFAPSRWDPAQAPVLLWPGFDAEGQKVAVNRLTGQTFPQGLIGTFAPGFGDPSDGMVIGGVTPGVPASLYTQPALGVAPRAGFAWDPFGRGRTAVRGGFGVFYDRLQGNPTMNTLPNPPTVYTPTVYYGWIDQIAEAAGKGILAPSTISDSLLGAQKNPATYNYSFGIQQQIGSTMMIDLSYVGGFSRHLPWKRNINPVPYGARWLDVHPENADPTVKNTALPLNFLRPYTGYGDINIYEFAATSNYNSLQASFSRRLSHGVMLGAAYTFSKALGSADSDTAAVSPFFSPRHRNYGPLGFDRTHVASLRYTWQLPGLKNRIGFRPLAIVASDWEISGTSRFQTGGPFTPGYALADYVDVLGGASVESNGARMDVVDPNAPPALRFGRPARGDWGNAGVNILRKPGINVWDISVYRALRFTERFKGQLRFESYNTFNHTQFNAVNQTARWQGQNQIDPTFLEPTSAVNPRRIQLAMRVSF